MIIVWLVVLSVLVALALAGAVSNTGDIAAVEKQNVFWRRDWHLALPPIVIPTQNDRFSNRPSPSHLVNEHRLAQYGAHHDEQIRLLADHLGVQFVGPTPQKPLPLRLESKVKSNTKTGRTK